MSFNIENISFGLEKHRSSSKKSKNKEKAKGKQTLAIISGLDKSQNKSDYRNKFFEEFSEWK